MTSEGKEAGLVVVVRRLIAASPEALFQAWTDPTEFALWWGPRGVVCEGVEFDLQVGGAYRIKNRLPDGSVIWISGEFEAIDAPRRLVYSWRTDVRPLDTSRVLVSFLAHGDKTEVIVSHERISSKPVSEENEHGWIGCLERLEGHFDRS